MAGGKGKALHTGGKAAPKDGAAKSQKSHSAKAGLQVSKPYSYSVILLSARTSACCFEAALTSPQRVVMKEA
jgi:hypothetical protein